MEILARKHNVFIYARAGEMQAKGNPIWDLPNVTWGLRLDGPFLGGTNGISRFHFYKWLKDNCINIVFFNEQQDISIVKEISGLGFTTGSYIDFYTNATVSDFCIYDFLICNTKRHYSVFKWHRNCLFLQWGANIDIFKPETSRPLSMDHIIFFHNAGMGNTSSIRKGTDLLVQAFQHVSGKAKLFRICLAMCISD